VTPNADSNTAAKNNKTTCHPLELPPMHVANVERRMNKKFAAVLTLTAVTTLTGTAITAWANK
jgi:hypothetical protein